MNASETAILCILWHKILQKLHSTSKSLPRPDMSLRSCVALYNGIQSLCQHLRDEFDTIEKDGLKLTTGIQKTYASQNKRYQKTRLLIMKERTLNALDLWKMLVNPFVLELTFQSLIP